MSPRRGLLLITALIFLFLLANRAAYKGYFSDDELDNLVQTRGAPYSHFARHFASPQLSEWNFRPVGHLYYKVLGAAAGLRFPAYVAVLHALHLLNVILVWLLLRRLGAGLPAAAAGAALFAFHMASFDAYWKPMFVFDVACAFFLIIAILLYLRGQWLLALIPYWCAYKTKEPAIALPAFLFLYEWMLGERRYRRVLPFALIAASFGLQALFVNRGRETAYALVFSMQALWTTLSFYSSKILLFPYAGLLLLPAAYLATDRRIRFGLAATVVLLGPMWFLPGRLFAVYLYVPIIGLAIAFCFAAEHLKPAWIAAVFLVWIPMNYMLLRQQRGVALGTAQERRAFVEQVHGALRTHPEWKTVLYDGTPAGLEAWGVRAAFHWAQPDASLQVQSVDSAEGRALLAGADLQVVSWNRLKRQLLSQAKIPGTPDPAFVDMGSGNPAWLFRRGWSGLETGYRWMDPEASVALTRPAEAREFALRINFGPVQFKDQGRIEIEVLLGGQSLGTRVYAREGWHEQRWTLPPGRGGPVEVTLRSLHPYRPNNGDPRLLGAAVAALGFVP